MEHGAEHQFNKEERAAARLKRVEAEKRGGFVNGLGVFVVASASPRLGFHWEVRRRDGIVLERSDESFQTIVLARHAGVRALAGNSRDDPCPALQP